MWLKLIVSMYTLLVLCDIEIALNNTKGVLNSGTVQVCTCITHACSGRRLCSVGGVHYEN